MVPPAGTIQDCNLYVCLLFVAMSAGNRTISTLGDGGGFARRLRTVISAEMCRGGLSRLDRSAAVKVYEIK